MSLDLRPLTLGELLDRSFSLYRRHFWLFVGIMALPSLLALAFGLLVALFNPQPGGPGSVAAQPNPAEILGALLWFGAAMIGMLIVYCITYAVALGATTVAVSQLYMGRPISIREAYAPLRGRVGRLALLLVLVSIRLFGVLLLMFVFMRDGRCLGRGRVPGARGAHGPRRRAPRAPVVALGRASLRGFGPGSGARGSRPRPTPSSAAST